MSEFDKICEGCDEEFTSFIETVCDDCHEKHEADNQKTLARLKKENAELKAKLAVAVEVLEFIEVKTYSDQLCIEELNCRAARVYEATTRALAKIRGEK